jgi:hypothetical protein
MAPILATTLGIFDIVVPGSNREALASHNQSLSIKSSHSEALASGVLDLKYEQKTLGLSFWCLFLRLSEQMLYIYRIHQKTPDRICPAFYIVYGCGVNRMN